VHALKGIDLDVEQGDFFALLGPNGAGKTTAIGIIASLVNKSAGPAHWYSAMTSTPTSSPPRPASASCRRKSISTSSRKCRRSSSTRRASTASRAALARKSASKVWLRRLQLWDKRDAISRTLSGGMKRRLMIARALVHEPRLLILDEPTAGVDIEVRRSMWEFLRQLNDAGTTIILTTHYLEEAENALPQHRDHRRGTHHRARPDGHRVAQAPQRGVRAQSAASRWPAAPDAARVRDQARRGRLARGRRDQGRRI
jgi:ABC-2 type transport system ATP-binding protein